MPTRIVSRLRLLALALAPLAVAATLRAQDALRLVAPFVTTEAAPSPAEDALSLVAAQRAQEMGLPALAADIYRSLLPRAGPGERPALDLALATACLDEGRPAEAEQVLAGAPGARGSAWHLRQGLAEAAQRQFDSARSQWASVKQGELGAADQPWYFFLQGELEASAGNLAGAGTAFQEAEARAGTELERARFFLAAEEERMRFGPVSEQAAEQIRQNAEHFQGTPFGYESIRGYAVMLNALGRRSEAEGVLRVALLTLPAGARSYADDFRLLIGIIAGPGDDLGRRELERLLATGSDPGRQRVALELLYRASREEPQHRAFRAELDRLLAQPTPHPIVEDLLLYRAVWSVEDAQSDAAAAREDYVQAGQDAERLLNKFPGSRLRVYALEIEMRVAWEQFRYRAAADKAAEIRSDPETPPGEVRAELGVLLAEAWFRAGTVVPGGDAVDFRTAADAYAAALRDPPASVPSGRLMFQLIQSQIEAQSLGEAQRTLDRLGQDPRFDPDDRWRAEWNLARALEEKQQIEAAYARVVRLTEAGAAGPAPSPELRARMAWLQAQLSLDAGRPAETVRLVDSLDRALSGLPSAERSEVAARGDLLRARAEFQLQHEGEALSALRRLRARYPGTDEAADSFFIEAENDARQDRIVEAQNVLNALVDSPEYRANPTYAPYALYQVALYSERLGQRKDLEDAVRLLERLVSVYPQSERVFYARLEEGDLLRKLNQYSAAQRVYEALRNQFPQRPDTVYALLALAECHDAQSGDDPAHADTAQALFEEVRDRADAPVDVRVEAGFNLGHLLELKGEAARAGSVWWTDVVTAFLLDPGRAAKLGSGGRYWMARTLLALGDLEKGQGRAEEARKAWRLIPSAGLPGVDLARARIAALDAPAPGS